MIALLYAAALGFLAGFLVGFSAGRAKRPGGTGKVMDYTDIMGAKKL